MSPERPGTALRRLRVQVSSERRRLTVRVAAAVLLAIGVVSAALGTLAPRWSADTTPRRVHGGSSTQQAGTALPDTGRFGGQVALFGQLRDAHLPTAEELGCDRPVRPDTAGRLDRLVIGDVAVTGLAVISTGRAEETITCSGSAMVAVQPLYLVARPGVDAMVPMAAFSAASLALVVGGVTLLLTRAEVGRA